MAVRSDPGLNLAERDVAEYLREQGVKGSLPKFEDLMIVEA